MQAVMRWTHRRAGRVVVEGPNTHEPDALSDDDPSIVPLSGGNSNILLQSDFEARLKQQAGLQESEDAQVLTSCLHSVRANAC